MARIHRSLFALVRLVLVLFAATLSQRAFAEAVQEKPVAGHEGTSLAAADTSQGSTSSGKDDSGDDDGDDDDGEEQR